MKLDFLTRFLFDKIPVRGAYLKLDSLWATIKNQKDYPDGIRRLLGELVVINILLSIGIKIKGKITTQIQNNDLIDFIVSECRVLDNEIFIRATAKFTNSINADYQITYENCISKGNLVVTLDMDGEGRIYQSIVSLNSNNLANSLENYMLQSEYLKTKIVIRYHEDKIIAFMLQQLPDTENKHEDDINRLFYLTDTLKPDELEQDELSDILRKLYPYDDILLFEEQCVFFSCGCSGDVVTNMLRTLGKKEVESILNEMGVIEVSCDYCNTKYSYYEDDIDNIFTTLTIDIENVSNEVH